MDWANRGFAKFGFRALGLLLTLGFAGSLSPSHAEDITVSENPENTHKPDRVIQVTVESEKRQEKTLKKIVWDHTVNKVITHYFGSSSESTLVLRGQIGRESPAKWHVIWNEKSFDVGSAGQISLELPFHEGMKTLELALVGPGGEVEYHFYRLHLEMPQVPSLASADEVPPGEIEFNKKLNRRFFISPGLGLSSIHFTQTSVDPYSSIVMTAKVSANYFLTPPKWDLGFTGFFNFVSLGKSASADVRFLGLNLRLGYIFPEIKSPWRLSLYGGWYYSTMFASDSSFGYKNISGPQLFPTLRRNLNNGHAFAYYFKFSPISNNFGLFSLSNNELATGISYVIPTQKRTYSVSFDYARIYFSDGEVDIGSRSISIGGSVTF